MHSDFLKSTNAVMKKIPFENIDILVATAQQQRGLDVNSLTHIIHYSLPKSRSFHYTEVVELVDW